jgi:hypothetical protein
MLARSAWGTIEPSGLPDGRLLLTGKKLLRREPAPALILS